MPKFHYIRRFQRPQIVNQDLIRARCGEEEVLIVRFAELGDPDAQFLPFGDFLFLERKSDDLLIVAPREEIEVGGEEEGPGVAFVESVLRDWAGWGRVVVDSDEVVFVGEGVEFVGCEAVGVCWGVWGDC